MRSLAFLTLVLSLMVASLIGGIYLAGEKTALDRFIDTRLLFEKEAEASTDGIQLAVDPGEKPLFYRDPMDKPEISTEPKKDSMGMDYLPVYPDDSEGTGRILFYRDPMGKAEISPTPRKDSMGMDYLPVRKQMPAKSAEAAPAQPPGGKGKILYYRNPMGLPDISKEPKKDSMGMDYIPVYENDAADDGNIVRISLDKVQKLGVATAVVEERKLSRAIRAVGTVQPDESRQMAVSSRFDGWVEKLYVAKTGDEVKRGQKLVEINSPDLREVQRDYMTSRRLAPDLTQVNLERLQSQGLSQAQIAELNDRKDVPRTTGIYAPDDGQVIEKPVIQGAWVKAGDLLYRLVDLRHVWVLAEIYERDLAAVKPGQNATVTFAAFPGQEFQGTVSLIYPEVSMATRTAKVRIELDNPDFRLKPGMYADVVVATDLSADLALTVPESAILDDGKHQVVLIDRGEGRFEPRAVKLGSRGNGYAEIPNGLASGDKVVVSANFLIDAESNLQAALRVFSTDKADVAKGNAPSPASDGNPPAASAEGGQ
jgi:Cu(I)/Ag(I) efflux system membrane fusion protein